MIANPFIRIKLTLNPWEFRARLIDEANDKTLLIAAKDEISLMDRVEAELRGYCFGDRTEARSLDQSASACFRVPPVA